MTNNHRIVIVDDEPAVLSALRRLFRGEPYEIRTTDKPYEALEWIHGGGVDVVIADQRMPEMSGIELLNLAQKCSPDTKRVLLTGWPESASVALRMSQVIHRLMLKPWQDDRLREVIRELLRIEPPPAQHALSEDLAEIFGPTRDTAVPADVHNVIETAVELCRRDFHGKAEVSMDFGDIPRIVCHPQRLLQVFVNLLAHAAERVRPPGSVAISSRREGNEAVVRMRHSGPGVGPSELADLFDPTSAMGLYTARKIVVSYGGRVELAPPGTEFVLRFVIG